MYQDISNHNIGPDFMAYLRGSSQDWDRYASITGDEGWSWDAIQTFIRKVRICLYL